MQRSRTQHAKPSAPAERDRAPGRRRRTALWVVSAAPLALAAIALAGALCCGPAPRRPLNVALIVIDTVRADAVGAAGAGGSITPNIDALAREGVTFVNAFAPAPWTLPSHASLFTGLFAYRHRTDHEHFTLADSYTTLAELLAQRGYQTAGFTCNPWLHSKSGLTQGFETYEEIFKTVKTGVDKGAAKATEMVTAWLDRRPRDKPFFLFVNYLEAHLPYGPPARVLRRVAPAAAADDRGFSIDDAEKYILGENKLSPEGLARVKVLYHAEVAYVDEQVGALAAALKAHGGLDDTLLIVLSDHGEHLGEHQLAGHEFSLFDPLLRVPLIVRHPKLMPAGQRITAPVCLTDVLPTVLAALGEPAPANLDGRSILPRDLAGPSQTDRPLLAEYAQPTTLIHEYMKSKHPGFDMSRFDRGLVSFREGQYKYVASSRGEESLYNLGDDPGEERDLAAAQPDRLARIRGDLSRFIRDPSEQ